MFDIGFLELAIIAVVGLIVIGPERLPEVARTVGTWVGKFRRFVGSVKSDIESELRQDEIRKALERDAGLDELKQIMNTETFTLEEEEKPEYQVKAVSDEELKQNESPSPRIRSVLVVATRVRPSKTSEVSETSEV